HGHGLAVLWPETRYAVFVRDGCHCTVRPCEYLAQCSSHALISGYPPRHARFQLLLLLQILPMTDSATSRVEGDEIDLLDLLVVIAENLKLLFFVPLFVGLVALGIAFVLPKTFASQSMLNTSKPGLDV